MGRSKTCGEDIRQVSRSETCGGGIRQVGRSETRGGGPRPVGRWTPRPRDPRTTPREDGKIHGGVTCTSEHTETQGTQACGIGPRHVGRSETHGEVTGSWTEWSEKLQKVRDTWGRPQAVGQSETREVRDTWGAARHSETPCTHCPSASTCEQCCAWQPAHIRTRFHNFFDFSLN